MDTPVDPLSAISAVGAERRRTPRFEFRVRLSGQASSARIALANVSEGGCLAYASVMLNAGDTHPLRFKDPGGGEELVLNARVVHAIGVSGHSDTVCVAGLEFAGQDDPGQRVAIDRLMALSS